MFAKTGGIFTKTDGVFVSTVKRCNELADYETFIHLHACKHIKKNIITNITNSYLHQLQTIVLKHLQPLSFQQLYPSAPQSSVCKIVIEIFRFLS